jgi:hypothetical protein
LCVNRKTVWKVVSNENGPEIMDLQMFEFVDGLDKPKNPVMGLRSDSITIVNPKYRPR